MSTEMNQEPLLLLTRISLTWYVTKTKFRIYMAPPMLKQLLTWPDKTNTMLI